MIAILSALAPAGRHPLALWAPSFIYEPFSVPGAAAIALTMPAVGSSLDLASAQAARNLVAASMAPRLIDMPLLVFACAVGAYTAPSPVIAAAVPTAATTYTMARSDAELMAQIRALRQWRPFLFLFGWHKLMRVFL